MKKIILTTLITGAAAASVFAQGTVSFKNGVGTPFKGSPDGVTSAVLTKGVGTPAPAVNGIFGNVTVDIFSAVTGTSLSTELGGAQDATSVIAALTGPSTPWSLSATQLGTTAYLGSGVWTTTTITLAANTSATTPVELEVIAFTGTLQSPTSFGFAGSTFSGGSEGWVQGTGGGIAQPVAIVTGAGGFNGLTLEPVPEPTTMALGGLGAAALLLFRRRK